MYFAMADLVVVVDGKVVLEEFGLRRLRFGLNFEFEFEIGEET
jgi:hypothetical protein